jgi:hypothetical protein
MESNIFSKAIVLFLLVFLLGSAVVYAQTSPVTEVVSVSATVGEVIVVTPGGGGSSHGNITIPQTAVSFSGYAYPNASVTLLKQGEIKVVVKANSAGEFTILLEEIYNSNILYSLFAQDLDGQRSLLINYPIAVQAGFITNLSGIRFAPTIVVDKSEVRAGDYLTVQGNALPGKEMEITIQGISKQIFTLVSSKDGSYKIVLPTSGLPKGNYSLFIKYKDDIRTSKLVGFIIGESNIFFTESPADIPGDCNQDKMINLIDFSILAFWYGKSTPPACVDTKKDNKIDLVDFSILAFYWTG